MLFDTHAHLNDVVFEEDRDLVIEEAYNSSVKKIINVGTNLNSSIECIKLAEKYNFLFSSVGIHPEFAEDAKEEDLVNIETLASHKKNVAIGEIGLDYHYKNYDKTLQKYWFKKQLKMAKRLELPVIIHDRDSGLDCINIAREENVKNGVFHCFSKNLKTAIEIIEMGFYISFTGIITFKNAKYLEKVIKNIPCSKILIETDCPYLSPEPFRGKRNTSKNVRLIAQKIAKIKNMDFEDIAKITTSNANKLFLNE